MPQRNEDKKKAEKAKLKNIERHTKTKDIINSFQNQGMSSKEWDNLVEQTLTRGI